MKMKFILILFIVLNSFSSFCQSNSKNENINNFKTNKHINIPGTRLFIIPPAGFKVSNSIVGLQQGEKSVIQFYDLDGGNFFSNAKTFSKQEFENKGATVFEYKEFKINNYPAKYIFIQGDKYNKAISLVFGDTSFCDMIMALFPIDDIIVENQIKKALKSVYYDKTFKVDPFASANFTINETNSIFKFTKFTSGLYMFTLNGIDKEENLEEAMLMVISIPKESQTNANDISIMFMNGLEKYEFTGTEVVSESKVFVNGKSGYEKEIRGFSKGKTTTIYQLIIPILDKALVVQGLIKSNTQKNLLEMRKIAYTIKFK